MKKTLQTTITLNDPYDARLCLTRLSGYLISVFSSYAGLWSATHSHAFGPWFSLPKIPPVCSVNRIF